MRPSIARRQTIRVSRRTRKGKRVVHEDDYGFWDDDRSYSLAGRRTRAQPPQRRPQIAQRSHSNHDVPLHQHSSSTLRARLVGSAGRTGRGLFWSRLGLLGLIGVVAISVALAVSSEGSLGRVAALNAPATAPTVPATTVVVTAAGFVAIAEPMVSVESATTTTTAAHIVPAVATTIKPAAAAQPRAPSTPVAKPNATCARPYKVVALDYWILIARKFNVSVKTLLAVNQANTSTALYPGRTVCLPANASAPKTTKSTATTPPSTTVKPTVKAAAAKPKAAQPTQPAIPSPPPLRNYSAAEVEQIIREVWPDDLEDQALSIARRESNLVPTARNSCCIGLFQIYWAANQRFLSTIGISSASMLFEPLTNANAAYAMYLRSGWGPWS